MIKIKINNKEVTASPGKNMLQVARAEGIEIPSMCFYEGMPHFTSCMICLVKNRQSGKLFPSCSVKPVDGMDIITDDREIHEARKKSLELLLSDHVGECEAPCKIACTANMDIPGMNRLLVQGKIDKALQLVRKDIALPSVLGRICTAPCEAVCRRGAIDETVSICLLKRYAGDFGNIVISKKEIISDKKVAVIGAGPAGLSAAFYIRKKGFGTVLFDKNMLAGGKLQTAIPEEKLPKSILNREIQLIEESGVEFRLNEKISNEIFSEYLQKYDAIILAIGENKNLLADWGIDVFEKGAKVNRENQQSNIPKVFVVGNAFRYSKMAIRSLGQGKDVAESVEQFLNHQEVKGPAKYFNSRFGKLMETEFQEYLKEATSDKQFIPTNGIAEGFNKKEIIREAARCLHCDCRKLDNCKLRDYSEEYQADQKKYKYGERKLMRKIDQHNLIIYEPGKCIKCSICVRLTEKYKEKLGLTFIGRGFDVQISVPFNESLNKGLEKIAIEVAEACPTGAMARKF
ncbi:MAG: 2Fe-2S iron-sulfur cluster-binding protein [Bacteroidota bacterium]|nr:2Fe-2S iron-sulfur cluster-binding protein [Bacteroidota bacterium]